MIMTESLPKQTKYLLSTRYGNDFKKSWYAIQILACELGNTTQMRVWALIKLRVKLGSWTLIMKKETSLQTLKGYEERNTFYVKVWLASLTQFKRRRKAFWRRCCWAEIFTLNGGSKQAKVKKTGSVAVLWELRRNWARPWKLQRGVGGWWLGGHDLATEQRHNTPFRRAHHWLSWSLGSVSACLTRARHSHASESCFLLLCPPASLRNLWQPSSRYFVIQNWEKGRQKKLRKMGKTERQRQTQKKTDRYGPDHTDLELGEKEGRCTAGDDHESGVCRLGNSEVQENWRVNNRSQELLFCMSWMPYNILVGDLRKDWNLKKKITNWCLDCASSNKHL